MNSSNMPSPAPKSGSRPTFVLAAVLIAAVVLAFALWNKPESNSANEPSQPETQASLSEAATPTDDAAATQPPANNPETPPVAKTEPPTAKPQPMAAVSTARREPTPYTRELVAGLRLTAPLTADGAAQWKANLQQLIAQGAAAIPAIQEFLDKNTDFQFGTAESQALGYESPRRALFDALQQIGGPEAVGVMAQVLQNIADPKEIAILAHNLAQQDPELYRAEVLNAVHETLAMASSKKLEGFDVGPLFEVLQKYGGPSAISDLENATGQWKYYATIALAQLPDGTGIPSLIRMAQDPNGAGKGTRDAALQMLAVAATQYPDARAALLEQVRGDKIPSALWPYLTSPLAGDQFRVQDSVVDGRNNLINGSDLRTTHIAFGNQNFISAPTANLTPDQINQQVALIDELLALTSNPAAVQALKQSKAQLSKRALTTAAVSPAQ